MAWNEPGGDKDNKDDNNWGAPKKNKKGDDGGPPDLDELLKSFADSLFGLFGFKSSGGNTSTPDDPKKFILPLILLGCIYVASGFFIVKPAERAVITYLGKYESDVGQGLHWIPPFIKSKVIVNSEKIRTIPRKGLMFTKDINLVDVTIEVQYRIQDVPRYLFNIQQPEKAIQEAADSALRQVIGRNRFDYIISVGKEQIASQVHEQLQETLDRYQSGIKVTTLALKEAIYPKEVETSFDDVTRAKEEREQLKHNAEAYANKIVPEAEGQAKKLLQLAKAYEQSVVLEAEGATLRFNAILPEYKKAPEVTRTRLYLTAMQDVYASNSKVFVDVPKGNSMLYLPIDKIVDQQGTTIRKPKNEAVEPSTVVIDNANDLAAAARDYRRGRTRGGRR